MPPRDLASGRNPCGAITYKGVQGHKFFKTPESFENNSKLQVRLELMTLRVPVRSDALTTSGGSVMSRVEI